MFPSGTSVAKSGTISPQPTMTQNGFARQNTYMPSVNGDTVSTHIKAFKKGRNPKSKGLFAQNILFKIAKKTVSNVTADKSDNSVTPKAEDATSAHEELLEKSQKFPNAPSGKKRYVDFQVKSSAAHRQASTFSKSMKSRDVSQKSKEVSQKSKEVSMTDQKSQQAEGVDSDQKPHILIIRSPRSPRKSSLEAKTPYYNDPKSFGLNESKEDVSIQYQLKEPPASPAV